MSVFLRAALAGVTVAAFAALAPAAPAAAPVAPGGAKAVTFPYPANAPVVVQVNGLGATRERLQAMLKAALPDEAGVVGKQLEEGVKMLLAERKLTAIPAQGRVFLVVNDIAGLAQDEPAVSVLVPVTGYKDFRESFLTADERKSFEPGKNGIDEAKLSVGGEHAVYMVDLKEYVAITPDKATAEVYAGKFTKATTAAMSADIATSFTAADFALFVNLDAINDKYGDQIRAVRGLIDFGIQQAQMGGALPGVGKKQLEAAKGMLQGVFQAVEDGRAVLLTAEFRPEGLNLRLQAQFADDTNSAKLLKAETPGPLADLAKLPAGLGGYTGSALGKKVTETLRGLNPEFAPADDDDTGTAAVEKRQKELLAAGPKGDVAAAGVSAKGGANVTLSIAAYDDPKKAAAALVGCYQAMTAGGRVQSAVLKDAPKVTADARKLQAFNFTEVRLAFDFEATVKDLPGELKENMLAQLKRSLSEKMTLWIGTDGKHVVQVSAKDWDAAAAALDRYLDAKGSVGETEGYKFTRKNLPAEVSLIGLSETGLMLTTLFDTLKSMEGTIPNMPKFGPVKAPKGDATFVGVAVTLKGDTATANFFVPTSAIAAARKILENLAKNVE